MILAFPSDLLLVSVQFTAVAMGILGAWLAKLIFAKAGAVVSAAAVCLGLAYFGWRPLFGGDHPPSTFFGATMLFAGLVGLALVGAIEESHRRMTTTADPRSGFPVLPSRPKESA